MLDQLVAVQQVGDIQRLSDEAVALDEFKGAVHDLHLAGPLALAAGDTDLGAGNQLLSIGLRAGQLVQEVGTVGALAVDGDLVVPPGLVRLNIGLHHHFGLHFGGGVLLMGHGLGLAACAASQQQNADQSEGNHSFHSFSLLLVSG